MSEPAPEEEDRWYAAWGLERDPFPAEGAPDFFARGGRERILKALADREHINRPLIGIVGEAGAGKSTLFHALLREMPEDVVVARVTAGVFLSASALLLAIARAMGLEIQSNENRESLRGRLRQQISAIAASGRRAVIMVDDAGDLEADALEELAGLAVLGYQRPVVRVMLFGRTGLRDALLRALGAERLDRLFHEVVIERYSLNELRGYLQFRLARAGLTGASPFSEDDYQNLFRRSGGLPGKANVLAREMLRARRAGLSREQLVWIAGGVAAALILAGLVVLLFLGGAPTPERASAPAKEAIAATVPEAMPAPASTTAPDRGTAAPTEERPSPAPAPSAPDRETGEVAAADDGRVDAMTEEADGAGAPAQVEPLRAGRLARSVSAPRASGTEGTAPAQAPAGTAGTAATTGVAGAPGTASTAEPAGAARAGAPARSVSATRSAASTPTAAEAAGADLLPGTSLLTLDPTHHTLQVMVVSSSARARTWIDARADPQTYRYYRRTRGGVPQYVVVYGDFADPGDASIASDRLAESAGVSGAFTRTLASVQEEIRDAR